MPRMKVKTAHLVGQAVLTEMPESQLGRPVHQSTQPSPDHLLPLKEALQIKAAEFWLKLGEADQALRELENLPHDAWNHPAALRVRVAAIGALRERSEAMFME